MDILRCSRVPADLDIKTTKSDQVTDSSSSALSGGNNGVLDAVYLPETKSLMEPRERLDLDLDRRAISDTACRYMDTCQDTNKDTQLLRTVLDWSEEDVPPADSKDATAPSLVDESVPMEHAQKTETVGEPNSTGRLMNYTGQTFIFEKNAQNKQGFQVHNKRDEGDATCEHRSDKKAPTDGETDVKNTTKTGSNIHEVWEAMCVEKPFNEIFSTPLQTAFASKSFGLFQNQKRDAHDQTVPEWSPYKSNTRKASDFSGSSASGFPSGPYFIGGSTPPPAGYHFIPPGVPSPFTLATPSDHANMFCSTAPGSPYRDLQSSSPKLMFPSMDHLERATKRRQNAFLYPPPPFPPSGIMGPPTWSQLPSTLSNQQHTLLAQGPHAMFASSTPRSLAPMPQPSAGHVLSFPHSHPYIYVSPNGLLTVILKYDVSVEMTLDRTIRVVNHRHKAVAATNSRGNSSCIYHIAAKIWQENTLVEADLFGERKALLTTDNCYLAAGSVCYCIRGKDVAPSPPSRFSDMTADRSVNLLFSSHGYGEHVVTNCEQLVQSSRYYPNPTGITVVVNGVRICQDERGDVVVAAGRKLLKVSPVLGSAMVRTHFVYMAVEMNWNVKVRRGNHSLDGTYVGLKVSNGTTQAGFDEYRVPFSEPAESDRGDDLSPDIATEPDHCGEPVLDFWHSPELPKTQPLGGSSFGQL